MHVSVREYLAKGAVADFTEIENQQDNADPDDRHLRSSGR